jgi:VCBS repeat-containing protein
VSGLSNVSAIGAGDSHSLAIQRTSNQLPLAQDDAYSTDEDVTLAVVAPGVLGNDSDPDGDSLTAILLSSPANGSISLNPDGSFTYTPNTNFNGTDSFTYQANDGNANSDIATVTITVSPVNDPPVADAGPDQTVDEGTVVQLDGSGSYDPDNNPLTYQWNQTSGPAVTLSDSASDMPTFTAPLVSTDTTLVFELVVNDGQVDSAPDSVQVTVLANPDNDDDGIRDEVDTQPNTYSSDFSDGTTLGTITNRGDQTLTVSDEPAPAGVRIAANITGGPTPATVSIAGGSSVVTLSAGDTVIVTVGSITIEVIIGPVEVAFTGDDGTTATTTLDAGYSLTFDPTTFTFTAPGSNPGPVAAVVDGESYTINPGETATIATNTPPVAQDDVYSTDEDVTLTVAAPGVLGNDSDPDGDSLIAILLSGPANGSISLNPDGSFTYTPNTNFNGTDSFTYQANDGNANSDIATVSITVNPVNDPPMAQNDTYSTDEDVTLTVAAPGVLGNDSDPDGDSLIAILLSGPANGSISLNPDGSFTYTPNTNFNGTDSFTYQANDGNGGSDMATVTITISPVNDPPVAHAGPYQTVEQTSYAGAEVTLDGSGSYDPDGDPLTYTWTWDGNTASGVTPTVLLPLGETTITLTVHDGKLSDTSEVVITVVDTTTPPEVTADFTPIHVEEDEGTFRVEFSATDICDPDPTVVAIIAVPVPADLTDWETELKTKKEFKLEINFEEEKIEIKGPDPEETWNQIQELGGIVVTDGQIVKIELGEDEEEYEYKYKDDVLKVEAPEVRLIVTAIDGSGNVGTTTVSPTFAPEEED